MRGQLENTSREKLFVSKIFAPKISVPEAQRHFKDSRAWKTDQILSMWVAKFLYVRGGGGKSERGRKGVQYGGCMI